MAENLEQVLLGDTTAKMVEKINKGISQAITNADAIEDIKDGTTAVGKLSNSIYFYVNGAVKEYNGSETVGSATATNAIGGAANPISNAVTATKDSKGNNIADKFDSLSQSIDGKISTSLKGVANGVASLGDDGKVPSSQLPSYVDDVLEYTSELAFPTEGEAGKIYVATDTGVTYRWGGSQYVEISASLAIGTTAGTAYAGEAGAALAGQVSNLGGVISDTQEDLNTFKTNLGNGTIVVNSAANDGEGNNIVDTYATKDEVQNAIDTAKVYTQKVTIAKSTSPWSMPSTSGGTLQLSGYKEYVLTAVYNKSYKQVVADITSNPSSSGSYPHTIVVDPSMVDSLVGGFVVLNYVGT